MRSPHPSLERIDAMLDLHHDLDQIVNSIRQSFYLIFHHDRLGL